MIDLNKRYRVYLKALSYTATGAELIDAIEAGSPIRFFEVI